MLVALTCQTRIESALPAAPAVTRKPPDSFPCPHCGVAVRVGRLSCRECGSDLSTGWQDPEELAYQQIEIPDTFEEMERLYDAGQRGQLPSERRPNWVIAVAILTLLGMVLSLTWLWVYR